MSVSGHDRVSPQSERNSESLTTELGEHLSPGFNPAPVLPYSIPVAGGCAYVCGTGHTHGTYGAAERCERPVAVSFGDVWTSPGITGEEALRGRDDRRERLARRYGR